MMLNSCTAMMLNSIYRVLVRSSATSYRNPLNVRVIPFSCEAPKSIPEIAGNMDSLKLTRGEKVTTTDPKSFCECPGRIVHRAGTSQVCKQGCISLGIAPTKFMSGFQVIPQYRKSGVSKTQSAGNPRHKSSLVGTSETTCPTNYPKRFCEWLAGIIDGDGTIEVSKQGYTSLEITMGLEDLPLLRYIQHMLGGGMKMRSGATAYRYKLHHKSGMLNLLSCINGHVQHSARLLQLHRVCQVHDIPVIIPVGLDAQSNWFAGFFDAEGTICISTKDELPQLSISVINKHLQDVELYKIVFGGNVYFDSGRNGYYQWSVHSREDVIMMLDYFKSSTFRSQKSKRFFLIEKYYRLYDLKAFKPDSIHHKLWLTFLEKWNLIL